MCSAKGGGVSRVRWIVCSLRWPKVAGWLHLREREKLAQRDAIQRLATMQYERNDVEFRRGVFRVRGEVLDIFPAEHSETAVRLTLFDDEVESIHLFDPLTGHILQRVPRCQVPGGRSAASRSSRVFHFNSRLKRQRRTV